MNSIKRNAINLFYLLIVVVVTSVVVSLSVTRKMNFYSTTSSLYDFKVIKDEVDISNTIEGEVQGVYVKEGDEVKKGDVIAKLSNPVVEERLKVLSNVRNNLSASTEAQLLNSQREAYVVKSTRDGIVYKVNITEGSYINPNTTIVTIHANNNVLLETEMTDAQLEEIQKIKSLSVYSPRLEQSFNIVYVGVGSAQPSDANFNTYMVNFQFENEDDGSLFFHGESVKVLGITHDSQKTPIFRIVNFWNSVLGQ